jgi:hypothetical protein
MAPLLKRSRLLLPCPGAAFYHQLQATRGRSPDQPFFDAGMGLDMHEAMVTIRKDQHADARENIYFIYGA